MGEAHHRAAVNHGSIMKSIHKSKQFSEQLFSFFHVLIFQASNTCNGFVDRLHSIICATFQIFILFQKLTFSHFQQESGSLFFLHVRLHVPNLCVHFIGYKLYVIRYTTFLGRHCFGDLLSHDLAIVAAEISFHFGDWVLKFRWQVSRDHV